MQKAAIQSVSALAALVLAAALWLPTLMPAPAAGEAAGVLTIAATPVLA